MNIGVLTNAFCEERFISLCIKQFKDFELDHVVLNSLESWNGQKHSDSTEKIAQENGATVISRTWQNEAEQFNWGLDYLSDKDWVLIVDSDERYTHREIDRILNALHVVSNDVIKIANMNVYWKNSDYVIVPKQIDKPVIAVRPNVRFIDKRRVDEDFTIADNLMHHFSYVRTNEEMKKKIESFSHANEIVNNWYEEKWLKWSPEMKNLHPVVPSQFEQAVYFPCPVEVRIN